METTVWKEKCIGNKLNIYTSIQCVVSRGVTLGKLGISQSGDCTQWGIHSHFPLKWSQTDKQVWVDSFITQIVPVYHLLYTGLSSWATSCLTKLISTTTAFKQFNFQKSYKLVLKNRKRVLRSSTNSNFFFFFFFRYYKDWGAKWGCYIPTYWWLRAGLLWASEPMPLLVVDRRYWSVGCRIGREWARPQRDLWANWELRWWPIPERDQAV